MAIRTTEQIASMTDDQAIRIKNELLPNAVEYAFAEYVKTNPSIDGAQRVIEQGGEFKLRFAALLQEFGITADSRVVAEWQKFYKEHFGLDVDFSKIAIPQRPKGNWRLLLIAKGMTMNTAFGRCKKLFATWQYSDDLDAKITQNARTSKEDYAVWVLDEVEPEKEYRGKSTRQADPDMKIGITVLERIIFELKYFSETGKHLDIKGATFCSGSRDSDGHVSYAGWYGGRFRIRWDGLDGSYSYCGFRSAVSL